MLYIDNSDFMKHLAGRISCAYLCSNCAASGDGCWGSDYNNDKVVVNTPIGITVVFYRCNSWRPIYEDMY